MPFTDPLDEDFDNTIDDDDACWSLDDLDRSADLGSLRSAWADAIDG
jgi:hypothetical protein